VAHGVASRVLLRSFLLELFPITASINFLEPQLLRSSSHTSSLLPRIFSGRLIANHSCSSSSIVSCHISHISHILKLTPHAAPIMSYSFCNKNPAFSRPGPSGAPASYTASPFFSSHAAPRTSTWSSVSVPSAPHQPPQQRINEQPYDESQGKCLWIL